MKSYTGISERFEYSATSIAGIRPVNEDAWCTTPAHDGLFCAVADGIGGHEAGDVASDLAIRIFSETAQEATIAADDHQTAEEILLRSHALAHDTILGQATGTHSGMGTTLVSAYFGGGMVTLCNTGDSRCTLIRSGIVLSLTKDHSFVQDLVDKGILTQEETVSHPMKNIITHSLGADFTAECTVHTIRPDDTLVLSSDGLHDFVSRETMIEAGKAPSAEEGARILMEKAASTSTDNITLIVVRVHDDAARKKQSE